MYISALFINKAKDTFKNLSILILFIVYPCFTLVLTQAMGSDMGAQMGEGNFFGNKVFISIFGCMHCIFTPIVAASSLISEEKEKNILKTLIFANVSLKSYFLSTGGFIWLLTMISGLMFIPLGKYRGEEAVLLMLFIGLGALVSIVLGSCIGFVSKNMASASAISVPIAMIFAFLPMLSVFNDSIKGIAKFTYGQQINMIISGQEKITGFSIGVITGNFLILLIVCYFIYRDLKKSKNS